MPEEVMILWNTKKLAKEFNMSRAKVARLLKSMGAKKYTNSTYIFELDSEGSNERNKHD